MAMLVVGEAEDRLLESAGASMGEIFPQDVTVSQVYYYRC